MKSLGRLRALEWETNGTIVSKSIISINFFDIIVFLCDAGRDKMEIVVMGIISFSLCSTQGKSIRCFSWFFHYPISAHLKENYMLTKKYENIV